MKIFHGSAFAFLLVFLIWPAVVEGRENVTDWYIQDFKSEFVLSADSTMTVTEWITADCGKCVGKHGIFRIVPSEARTENGVIKTLVELRSITDFEGKPYEYTESENRSDATLTWKIGDPDKTVTGVNRYKIVYEVKNVIRSSDAQFDEFYWNLNGNFWILDIESYSASVVFPVSVKKNAEVAYYTGMLGSKANDLATVSWKDDRTLSVAATRMLRPGEGITASVSVPKGIFIPYRFSWWELYGSYLWFLLPLVTFMYCYRTWRKYGDDPSWDSIVIPEYEAPNNLDALELGMLSTNGTLSNEFVTAGIIELAVRGVLKIREEKNKILFFTTTDYVLEKTPSSNVALASHQSLLLDRLFESADSVKLSDLKNKFYKNLGEIGKSVTGSLAEKGLIEKQGLSYRTKFMGGGIVLIFLSVFISGAAGLPVSAIFSGAVSGILVIYFGVIMPKRTLQGVEANWKIKGLKLFMEKAEKHRQQFYEKENMFETLLPYAIVFGMTGEWIKKMRDIYGEAYFTGYHPAWFMASDMGNFDVDNFSASMESLSSAIADNTGTSSGSGGSGSSGGGGGGGGGGGW